MGFVLAARGLRQTRVSGEVVLDACRVVSLFWFPRSVWEPGCLPRGQKTSELLLEEKCPPFHRGSDAIRMKNREDGNESESCDEEMEFSSCDPGEQPLESIPPRCTGLLA